MNRLQKACGKAQRLCVSFRPRTSNRAMAFLWITFVAMASIMAKDPSHHSPQEIFEAKSFTASNGDELLYRLMKPQPITSGALYPLIIFLHGAGERGSDNLSQLKHGVKELCGPDRRQNFPCFVIAPQCPSGQRWAEIDWTRTEVTSPSAISRPLELTFEVVDQILEELPVDSSRIYITGLSMGGYGTWDAIVRRPHFFAAAMPICGGGDPSVAQQLLNTPIACFHGELDKAVSPDKSRRIVQALRDLGGNPIYVEYPGVGHDSWTETYSTEKNWQWMFDQKRSNPIQ
jgi:predicted peptidase